ncbi:MAG: dTDP-4-amino-4,6-dideoxygalactose transaminase [Acidimicrobiales bacterium]|jgi:dTDP-4-amino-4,6-dideoxygalactose transaminase
MIPVYDPKPEVVALRPEFDAAIAEVLDTGSFILGPQVARLEEQVAEYIGTSHAIGVNSGTDALFIALRAAGVKPGDEVITSSFTFFATGESINAIGATPVFADVDLESYNLDPDAVKQAVTAKTSAIIPVHLFGRPTDMTAFTEIATASNLAIIEDCAQSFGAACSQARTGSIGTAGAFSFFPSKNLGGFGDGGMITTNDEEVAAQARMLRAHGSKKRYFNEVFGYNSRLDSIQAAVLSVKMQAVEANNEKRRAIASAYNETFGNLDGITVPGFSENDHHVFHQYTMRVTDGSRESLGEQLKERGVSTAVYYPVPLHELPVYADQEWAALPNAELLAREVLSLPMFPGMTDEQLQTVLDAVVEAKNS